jgi:hypothetical protein
MGEVLIAIMLACQVNGVSRSYTSYETAKTNQMHCQKALTDCVVKKGSINNPVHLQKCILEGKY